ncbi:hypothetical protein Poly24_27580 [Rosistilla carotiformis]|uniref:Uncharacterized protein n=1 Tax=Rosistilla carotiformis TaxID=2528017 RepID=A0A518JU17_9BACT|nr:hypothetical protein Poly24_27580 [Rosistilla carotiformis]
MLNETPIWEFQAKQPLIRWYGHVRLLTDKVVGQWFCLDRQAGLVHWEHNLHPDEIVDIVDGVIVANERRRQHIGSLRYGCYGISLDTGEVSWTSHSSGLVENGLPICRRIKPVPNCGELWSGRKILQDAFRHLLRQCFIALSIEMNAIARSPLGMILDQFEMFVGWDVLLCHGFSSGLTTGDGFEKCVCKPNLIVFVPAQTSTVRHYDRVFAVYHRFSHVE